MKRNHTMENQENTDETDSLLESNSNTLTVIARPTRRSMLASLVFLFLVIIGLTGQTVTLPLWIDSASRNASSPEFQPFADQYFYLVLPALTYAIIFGLAHLVNVVFIQPAKGERKFRRVPQRYLMAVGFMFGTAAIFIVFAASGKRTAPYLQSILTNVQIPATLIIRFLALKKIPTRRKLICALATVVALLLCLLPSIVPEIDPVNHMDQGGAEGVAGVLWPFCFMTGFIFTSMACILQERAFAVEISDSKKPPDLVHAICWMEIYQALFIVLCFWVDALPGFGSASSIKHVGENLLYGMQCFVGKAGCTSTLGLLGTLFISFFALYIVGANYLLAGEGAAYLVIVQSVVTPLGFFFWTLFKEQPHFHWKPEVSITTWMNIAGIVIMVPAIYFYNTGLPERTVALKVKDKHLNTPSHHN